MPDGAKLQLHKRHIHHRALCLCRLPADACSTNIYGSITQLNLACPVLDVQHADLQSLQSPYPYISQVAIALKQAVTLN